MLLSIFLLAAPVSQVARYIDPARVLVIYDTSEPDANGNGVGDSEEVALGYAAKRGIPAANLFPVTCSPSSVTYSGSNAWSNFYNEVVLPVQAELNAKGQTTIDTLLFCHGVPYKLGLSSADGGVRSLDQAMATVFNLGALPAFPSLFGNSSYTEKTPGYQTDTRHFEHITTDYQGENRYLVARLDGPGVSRSMDLVEGALYGDKYISTQPGYYSGRLYVDTRFKKYLTPSSLSYPGYHNTYAAADRDMAWATQNVDSLGFPMSWENTTTDTEIGEAGAVFKDGSTGLVAPDALFYYGWYNYNKYQDVFDWKPGSAACDLNSNSLAGIEQEAPGTFLGESFAKGLTCGAGVIAEPYLTGHPYPETFAFYLLTGYSFAESANVSDPTALWRGLYVGDPLYCPLKQNKVASIDTTAPPIPTLSYVGGDTINETYRLEIDTTGTAPDLVVVGGTYGLAPLTDHAITTGMIYSMQQDVTFSGLTAGLWRANLDIIDPVGNATTAPEILFINDGQSTLATAAQSDSANPAGAFKVELGLRVPGGIASVTTFAATADAPSLGLFGLDLFALGYPLTIHGDLAMGETLSLEVSLPAGLPSGSYDFHVAVADASSSSSSTTTVTVP